jgi:hypothetical protein
MKAKAEPTAPREREPDLRHPMVVEADNVVHEMDEGLKIMEDCF